VVRFVFEATRTPSSYTRAAPGAAGVPPSMLKVMWRHCPVGTRPGRDALCSVAKPPSAIVDRSRLELSLVVKR
jgi:hypothetical protein